MLASVNSNQGFYIGRYEVGFIGETAKTTYTSYTTDPTQEEIDSETEKLVVQKDAQIYNYVPWGSAMDDITAYNCGTDESPAYVIGAVELATNFDKVNNYSGVTSTLIYGIQWDMVLRYVADENHNVNDSSSWGNYAPSPNDGILQTTGKNSAWQAKKIYDLAGNIREYTMECASQMNNGSTNFDYRVVRGGDYDRIGTTHPASHRYSNSPYDPYDYIGFRLALYL